MSKQQENNSFPTLQPRGSDISSSKLDKVVTNVLQEVFDGKPSADQGRPVETQQLLSNGDDLPIILENPIRPETQAGLTPLPKNMHGVATGTVSRQS